MLLGSSSQLTKNCPAPARKLQTIFREARECRYLINGEPTDNRLAIGTKGSVRVFITTEGRAAHSAYPEAGDSAIEKLLDILQDIRAVEWPEDSFFGTTTCNIGVLSGGTRPNVIPDKARAELQIRLGIDIEHVKRLLEEAVGGRGQSRVCVGA